MSDMKKFKILINRTLHIDAKDPKDALIKFKKQAIEDGLKNLLTDVRCVELFTPMYFITETETYLLEVNGKAFDNSDDAYDYDIRDRETVIDDLFGWIAEAKEDQGSAMRQDLELLSSWDCEWILSSTGTNDYLEQDSKEWCEFFADNGFKKA